MKRTPVKKINASRKATAFTRAYGSPERVEWVRRQPCAVCGHTPSENAHVRSGGAGRKADACWVAPLCHPCHAELHRGAKSFVAAHQIDLDHEASITDARWEQHTAQHKEKQP